MGKFIGGMLGFGFALFLIVFVTGGAYLLAMKALDALIGL